MWQCLNLGLEELMDKKLTSNRRTRSIILVILITLTAIISIIADRYFLYEQSFAKVKLGQINALKLRLGLHQEDGWHALNQNTMHKISKWKPKSIKVVYELASGQTPTFIINKKRSLGKRSGSKDLLHEFPGGRVDKKEDIQTAVLREVEEEDNSKILLSILQAGFKGHRPILFKNIKLNKEHHSLLKTKINMTEWTKLSTFWESNNPYNNEVYKIIRVPLDHFHKKHPNFNGFWTPKTMDILKALRKKKYERHWDID